MNCQQSVFKDPSETKLCDETNGLVFNDVPVPEEIIMLILSHVDVKDLLCCKLVCREWNALVCSTHFWRTKLKRIDKTAKSNLPWYVYYCYFASDMFDKNLLKNGNGESFTHWKIVANGGNKWKKEDTPQGADTLPENVPDFNGAASCFATSYNICAKLQKISFHTNKLVRRVLNEFRPTIYLSEWYAGRFDCGCHYILRGKLYNSKRKLIHESEERRSVIQWAGRSWTKVEMKLENYEEDVAEIEFYHEGSDTQYWLGHYGSKMAGGVVKILFDSLET